MMRRLFTLSLSLVAVSFAGCGSKGNAQKPTFPVTGQLFYDGKPAANATVIFHPEGDATGVRPQGKVAADGTYKLTTYTSNDGAPEGNYRVTVEWWLSPGGDQPATNRLPEIYKKPESSRLTATVNAAPTEIPTIKITR